VYRRSRRRSEGGGDEDLDDEESAPALLSGLSACEASPLAGSSSRRLLAGPVN